MKEDSEDEQLAIHDQLRDVYIPYKECASRCKMEILTQGSGSYSEENRSFYYPPKCIFLDEPDAQKKFRTKFIEDIS